ncbi:hypothetical protein PMAYCL1PPCAC_15237, partial [Pristionchus mayeri]
SAMGCCDCLHVEKYKIPGAEPTFFLSMRFLGFWSMIFPAITAYVCIISTFYTQADIISNYSLANCPHVKSPLPPISYSIGSWEPQKQMWMFAVIVHMPSRMLLSRSIPQIWLEGIWRLAGYAATTIEMFSLTMVSLFYVDSIAGFEVHAAFFGMWWGATVWGMSIMIHMQRVTGHIYQDPYIYRSWLVKSVIMTAYIIVSCTTSIAYPISQRNCSLFAFTIFCIGEYTIITLNAAFWAIVLLEVSRDFEGFRIVAVMSKRRAIEKYSTENPTMKIAIKKKIEKH